MPIPGFITELREQIGHRLLWLPGVTGLVINEDNQVLLVQRADTLRWALVTGCLEPGEQPATGIVREILEETGITATAERVLSVEATNQTEHANGDKTVFLDVAFVCKPLAGVARVNDDESVDVRWFPITDLPGVPERHQACVKRYLDGTQRAWFARS